MSAGGFTGAGTPVLRRAGGRTARGRRSGPSRSW
jgi:hypothetical protein